MHQDTSQGYSTDANLEEDSPLFPVSEEIYPDDDMMWETDSLRGDLRVKDSVSSNGLAKGPLEVSGQLSPSKNGSKGGSRAKGKRAAASRKGLFYRLGSYNTRLSQKTLQFGLQKQFDDAGNEPRKVLGANADEAEMEQAVSTQLLFELQGAAEKELCAAK